MNTNEIFEAKGPLTSITFETIHIGDGETRSYLEIKDSDDESITFFQEEIVDLIANFKTFMQAYGED